jgi:hypothetical protein
LSRETATFGEEGTDRRCFVGTLTQSDISEREWSGDEVKVEVTEPTTSKGLWVGYVGETDSRRSYVNLLVLAIIIIYIVIWQLRTHA